MRIRVARCFSITYNFQRGHRDQPFLLPRDLRDWRPRIISPGSCSIWSTSSTSPRSTAHRDGGHGHPAQDLKLSLGVLLYGYCLGLRHPPDGRALLPGQYPPRLEPVLIACGC